mmetsp:Transcript_7100/g.15680  ORF Transcript_7100/g.15680 Transcript_7100/m.15680 type:complete len:266 (-) Transcript_7100:377-1174(-)
MSGNGAVRCSFAPGAGRRFLSGEQPPKGGERGPKQAEEEAEAEEEDDGGVQWKAFAAIAVFAGALGAFLNIRQYIRQHQAERRGSVVKPGPAIGRPELGGEWELTDHNNKVVRSQDHRGSWVLLYFGFTYCPDICPNELIRLLDVMATLDKDPATKDKLAPLFVTIDPERDGPAQLKDYLADWDPRILGLTGTPEKIDKVCKDFRVYYAKAALGPDPNDYLIDHSVMFYLVDPLGRFVNYYGANLSSAEIAAKISSEMKAPLPPK